MVISIGEDIVLHVEGRNIERADYLLQRTDVRWEIVGNKDTSKQLSEGSRMILGALVTLQGAPPAMLAHTLNMNSSTIRSHLKRMSEVGLVIKLPNGNYIPATDATPATEATDTALQIGGGELQR
jgi:hypothetical protein